MRFFASLALLLCTCVKAELVILMYHHVAEDTPASTSVTPEQFNQHLELIESLELTVVDLVDHIEAMKRGDAVPERAVAITFDDAWQNIYQNAHPMLAARDWPYAIFVNTQPVDQGRSSSMSWDTLRTLHNAGVRILNHTSNHKHLVHDQFKGADWLANSLATIEEAQTRLEQELGELPRYLAYPYGEYNTALTEALAERGYTAFGQHSGAVGTNTDWLAIPRFPAAGIYANTNTLRNKLLSRPFPFSQWPSTDPIVAEGQTLSITLPFAESVPFYKGYLQCFFEGETLKPSWQDNSASLTIEAGGQYGRHRINCTAPASAGRFYWYSQPYLGHRDGVFPDY
ncbi:polysaccharide deacetylase family protein [Salinibius halmophilus]|uniref:polysaccharide deacetylase family protein n=1 Tax=Salinibius halmophilus TaxID=1853216 RepID=UPI000E66FB9F|nr:polysaccharide deacetylase family protein [Salinibius halmophilus]